MAEWSFWRAGPRVQVLGETFTPLFQATGKITLNQKNPFLLCKKMASFFFNEPLQNTDISLSISF
jgi:hypothetical protein